MKFCSLRELTARNAPPGKYADGQGLWLMKRERICGKWIFRYELQGRRREMGLGAWPDVSIVEARSQAAEARKALRGATDPIEARKRAKRTHRPLTVKQAVEGCFEARKAELKGDGEAGRWMSPLTTHVIPKIGNDPVENLDQHVLKDLLAPIWHEKPEAALKALHRVGLTLKHCAALGLNVDLQATMKARALLGKQRHTTVHIPALPYEDAPAFYQWLVTLDTVSARALRFLMLTLARTSEVRLAPFTEISGDIWTIPPERTKVDREHRVPLTPPALKIVEACREHSKNGFLFPAYKGQPISDNAMAKLMKDHGYSARPHGFRATFRTWVEEQTDTPMEVKEGCLAHTVETDTQAAYQRSDRLAKRRALLEQWTAFLRG